MSIEQFYEEQLRQSYHLPWEEVKVKSLKIRAILRQMHFSRGKPSV